MRFTNLIPYVSLAAIVLTVSCGDNAESEDVLPADVAEETSESDTTASDLDIVQDDLISIDTLPACAEVCQFDVSPAVGMWTSDFSPATDCTCDASNRSCHALYVGRVVSVEGNQVSLEFKKAGSAAGPTADLHYWIITAGVEPDCSQLDIYAVRSEGTWPANTDVLSVITSVWPDENACKSAADESEQALFIVTGGSDSPDDRIWFQKERIWFPRTCP